MPAAPISSSSHPVSSYPVSREFGVPVVGRWTQMVTPFLLASCFGAACLAFSLGQADPTEASEGRFLSLLAAGVVACAAVAAQLGGGKWLPVPAAGSVLVLLSLWFLHQGPQRGGSVVLVLVVTLAAGLARSWWRVGHGPWAPSIAWASSLAVGVQWLVRPELILTAESEPFGRLWLEGILLPAAVGICLGLLAGALGRAALLVGLTLLLAGPGFDLHRIAILGPLLLLTLGTAWLWRRSGIGVAGSFTARLTALEPWAAQTLLVVGSLVVVLSSYPWLRPSPWGTLPSLLLPPRTVAVPFQRGVVPLSPDSPLWRLELPTAITASRLVLDSSLVHGLAAGGETVASVRAQGTGGRELGEWALLGGVDTAEWAAGRADVRSLEGFLVPEARSHYVPPGGGFFANRYRTVLDLGGPHAVAALEIRLAAPVTDVRPWELHLVRVELRR